MGGKAGSKKKARACSNIPTREFTRVVSRSRPVGERWSSSPTSRGCSYLFIPSIVPRNYFNPLFYVLKDGAFFDGNNRRECRDLNRTKRRNIFLDKCVYKVSERKDNYATGHRGLFQGESVKRVQDLQRTTNLLCKTNHFKSTFFNKSLSVVTRKKFSISCKTRSEFRL